MFYNKIKEVEVFSLKSFYQRYQNFFSYTLFGTLAGALNIILFHQLEQKGLNYLLANIIAYLIALLFTFITNKYLVFETKHHSLEQTLRELIAFLHIRFLSFLLDLGLMFLGVQVFLLYKDLAKLLDQIVCGILNYFFSKWLIFNKKSA
ncbi:GtrA family protein [Ligilactobacillus faecis]|uniref:GtrA family protein n=1 Tax=Ligilactobacillus faecis TaxID=762833 RepID=A0ABV4DU53_9LACO